LALTAPTLVLGLGSTSCAKSQRFIDDGVDAGEFGSKDSGTGLAPLACSDDNKNVFVIAEDRSFYSFHPPTGVFENRGLLDCPTGGATPTSMAIDRNGIAW